MKIALVVTGSREITNPDVFSAALSAASSALGFDLGDTFAVVHGGARGVDTLADAWAKQRGITPRAYKPDYRRDGDRAPLIRNERMIRLAVEGLRRGRCDRLIVLGIPHPKGSGTQHALGWARRLHPTPGDIYTHKPEVHREP